MRRSSSVSAPPPPHRSAPPLRDLPLCPPLSSAAPSPACSCRRSADLLEESLPQPQKQLLFQPAAEIDSPARRSRPAAAPAGGRVSRSLGESELPPPVPMDQDARPGQAAAAEPMEGEAEGAAAAARTMEGEAGYAAANADPMEDEAADEAGAVEPMEDDPPTSSPTRSAPSATVAVDDSTIARKRRRRKKQFPGMIPTAGVHVAAVVLPRIGGVDQTNYLVVRNHVLAEGWGEQRGGADVDTLELERLVSSFLSLERCGPTGGWQARAAVGRPGDGEPWPWEPPFDASLPAPPISYPITTLAALASRAYLSEDGNFHLPFNRASVPALASSPWAAPLPPRRHILACHDLRGGYRDNAAPQGGDDPGAYALWHWHLVDVFVYFSHYLCHALAAVLGQRRPPPRRQEWDKVAEICKEMLATEASAQMYAERLTELAAAAVAPPSSSRLGPATSSRVVAAMSLPPREAGELRGRIFRRDAFSRVAAAVLIHSRRSFDGARDGAGSRRLSPMAAAAATTETHGRATAAAAANGAAPGQTRYGRRRHRADALPPPPLTEPNDSSGRRAAEAGRAGDGQRGRSWAAVHELLAGRTLDRLRHVRREEVARLVGSLSRSAADGEHVDVDAALMGLTSDIVSHMVMGRRWTGDDNDTKEMRSVVAETAELTSTFNLQGRRWTGARPLSGSLPPCGTARPGSSAVAGGGAAWSSNAAAAKGRSEASCPLVVFVRDVICVNAVGGTPAERADEARHLLAADVAEPI
uniref:Glycosyl hydrolase family 85-like protein n=1 Tax=Oryza sativa subsp. japonica TaxID=39947 RepID=Q5Z4D5_ORYSJ|nr:glycosyl hydrolase family 85-like protein [Oryza sativa Japonica Group]